MPGPIFPQILAARVDNAPLMEIQLELVANEVVWKPELTEGKVATSVREMCRKWLKSFVEIGQLMKRLDVGEGNYMKELEEDYDVFDAMNQVRQGSMEQAHSMSSTFSDVCCCLHPYSVRLYLILGLTAM
jgi:hypothetical protein